MYPKTAFPYLGHTVAYNNRDWTDLYQNLKNSWKPWGMVMKVLTNIGPEVRAWAMMYTEVVHTVFVYGGESWVVTGAMLTVLEGFHHHVDR